ncbi:HAD-superfamily hydrolase subfamily IA, variant 3 [Minicystis rosea]|nr:HAD-superfamily hydrolase subfamily IA, variant 3 [Minicystis rosea]
MIRAVLFDFGGVIASSPFSIFRDYEARAQLPPGFLQGLNMRDPDGNAWACMERGEIDAETFYRRFEAEAQAAGGTIDARALFGSFAVRVRPEMVSAVRALKARGYRVACVTNNMRLGHGPAMTNTPELALEVEEAMACFDHVVESCKIGARKPETRFFEHACQRVGVAPHACVLLDDLGINLKTARALGMTTIKVIEPGSALTELASVLGLDVRFEDARSSGPLTR